MTENRPTKDQIEKALKWADGRIPVESQFLEMVSNGQILAAAYRALEKELATIQEHRRNDDDAKIRVALEKELADANAKLESEHCSCKYRADRLEKELAEAKEREKFHTTHSYLEALDRVEKAEAESLALAETLEKIADMNWTEMTDGGPSDCTPRGRQGGSVKKTKSLPSTEELNDELFSQVETIQGYAFISDGMGTMEREAFFDAVRQSQWYALRTAQVMLQFLDKYGRINPPTTPASKERT